MEKFIWKTYEEVLKECDGDDKYYICRLKNNKSIEEIVRVTCSGDFYTTTTSLSIEQWLYAGPIIFSKLVS